MAYNEALAERIWMALAGRPGVTERKMFGGLTFMVGGNMFCGVVKDDLMVRVGPESYDSALAQRGARPMDFTGRPMKGMLFVGPEGYATNEALADWVDQAFAHARSLPPKGSPRASRRSRGSGLLGRP